MKKSLVCAILLALLIGAGSSLQAAECPAGAPFTPAAPVLALQEGAGETGAELTDILALSPINSAQEKAPPPSDCSHIACILTPEGCGCEGFWCGDIFICGIPWH